MVPYRDIQCKVRFHSYCQPLMEHVIIREVTSLRSKPFILDRHNRCWQCTFLQTSMLHLHNSVDYSFSFMLWQCCAHCLVGSEHNKTLAKGWKTSWFGSKILVFVATNSWKVSQHLVKNIQWFHTFKCWSDVLLLSIICLADKCDSILSILNIVPMTQINLDVSVVCRKVECQHVV